MDVQRDAPPAQVAAEADAGLTAGHDLGGFFDEMLDEHGEPR